MREERSEGGKDIAIFTGIPSGSVFGGERGGVGEVKGGERQ